MIKAGPEMLKALEYALNQLGQWSRSPQPRIRRAIAAAKGEL